MFFSYPEDFKTRDLALGVNSRLIWGERLMFSLVHLDADTTLPRHKHEHEQSGIIFKGRLEVTIGNESRVLHNGDAYVVPSNVEHSARTFGECAEVLDSFAPPREDYK